MKGAKEFTGRSLDEAIEAACKYYDLPREKLEVEIVNDSKTGIFGLVGAKKAKILAKQASVENYTPDLSREKPDRNAQPAVERAPRRQASVERAERADLKPAGRERPRRQPGMKNFGEETLRPEPERDASEHAQQQQIGENLQSEAELKEAGRQDESAPEKRGVERAMRSRSPKPGVPRSRGRGQDAARNRERTEASEESQTENRDHRRSDLKTGRFERASDRREGKSGERRRSATFSDSGYSDRSPEFPAPTPSDEFPDSVDFPMDFDAPESGLRTLADIDQEKAMLLVKETLGELLKPICDNAEITVCIKNGRIEAGIDCADASGLIIGREGQTLSALQYMASRIISRRMEAAVHVHLDTGEYKERQEQKLRELSLRLAERARETGRTQYTRPLSSYHRRIVHMILQEEEDIETRSKGDGAMKRVYIFTRRAELSED